MLITVVVTLRLVRLLLFMVVELCSGILVKPVKTGVVVSVFNVLDRVFKFYYCVLVHLGWMKVYCLAVEWILVW